MEGMEVSASAALDQRHVSYVDEGNKGSEIWGGGGECRPFGCLIETAFRAF